MDLMSRDADAENTDNMLRNSVKFIVPGFDENTTHIRPANGFSCRDKITSCTNISPICTVCNKKAQLTPRLARDSADTWRIILNSDPLSSDRSSNLCCHLAKAFELRK